MQRLLILLPLLLTIACSDSGPTEPEQMEKNFVRFRYDGELSGGELSGVFEPRGSRNGWGDSMWAFLYDNISAFGVSAHNSSLTLSASFAIGIARADMQGGTLSFCHGCATLDGAPGGSLVIGTQSNLCGATDPRYAYTSFALDSGTLEIRQTKGGRTRGSFSGTAVCMDPSTGAVIPGRGITITEGEFDLLTPKE
jgi:hypothetical protein